MDVFRQIVSVLVVFALLGATVWSLRRSGKISFAGFTRKWTPAPTKAFTAVERLTLTPQHTLHLIRIHGQELLVATHPQGCSVMNTTDQAKGAAS
jgi:flagellar biogenesis protein FliO